MQFNDVINEISNEYKKLNELQKQEARSYKRFCELLEEAREQNGVTYEEVGKSAGNKTKQFAYNVLKYKKRTKISTLWLMKHKITEK